MKAVSAKKLAAGNKGNAEFCGGESLQGSIERAGRSFSWRELVRGPFPGYIALQAREGLLDPQHFDGRRHVRDSAPCQDLREIPCDGHNFLPISPTARIGRPNG